MMIVGILVAVRTRELKFRFDRCYLHEKYLVSASPILFARDFICFYNTTCFNQTTINWNNSANVNQFSVFMKNVSEVATSLQNVTLDPVSLFGWVSKNPDKVDQLTFALGYLQGVSSILTDLASLMTQISTGNINQTTVNSVSKQICNSDNSDLATLLKLFAMNRTSSNTTSRSKRETSRFKPCQLLAFNFFNGSVFTRRLWNIINPMIWGKIFYTPDTEFTRELMKRANLTYESLDYLRLMSIQWRTTFRDQLEYSLTNGTFSSQIGTLVVFCESLNRTNLNPICNMLASLTNATTVKTSLNAISMPLFFMEEALNCSELNRFVALPNAAAMDSLSNSETDDAMAGLIFNGDVSGSSSMPTLLDYSIRMSTYQVDSTRNFKVLDRFWTPSPRINTFSDMKYYTSAFLTMQQSISTAFTEMLTSDGLSNSSRSNNNTVSVGASVQIMPYPCYVEDKFIRFLSTIMPLFFVISFSSTFTFITKAIVFEKEKRLKEFMRVMGLSNFVHWLGWFIVSITLLSLSCIIMTLLLYGFKVLPYSSAAVIFLLLFSYAVCIICQSFMVSVFFDNANIAGVVGGIIYFFFYLPYMIILQNQDSIGSEALYASSLFAQVAFCNAFNFIASWEQTTIGAQYSNLFQSTVLNLDFGVGHCIMMLWVDSLIYLLITWYVEAVFPGQYGVPRPWYFPVTTRYWCGDYSHGCCPCYHADVQPVSANNCCSGDDVLLPPDKTGSFSTSMKSNCASSSTNTNSENKAASKDVEEEPRDLEMGISIRGLCKTYGSSQEPAVDKLSLNFYQSQITAFLGHNGAGKTTTISMLTGIVPASAGTALILGHDIRTDMDSARELIGLCPQHNILFDSLTVADHVYFYGMLKGLPRGEIKQQLPRIVAEVGLSRKVNTYAKRLSGGMKRKLSIAMAFIGNSQVVFLDEPTAGVDPFARRGIWDMLVRYRDPTRTIILTTHHMDEADYLADRIAIISRGRLRCAGSSVFLKRAFGDGFYLTLEKNVKLQKRYQGGTDNTKLATEAVAATARVLEFVVALVPSACLVDENRGAWTLVLPVTELPDNNNSDNQGEDHGVKTEAVTSNIPALLSALDRDMDQLQVASYGVTDTSLEEVFLKVAEEPVEDGNIPVMGQSRVSLRRAAAIKQGDAVEDNKQPEEQKQPIPELVQIHPDDLLTGLALTKQQFIGLQAKRFHYTKRNVKGFVAELILPVVLILVMVVLLKTVNLLSPQPAMVISPWLMMPKTRSISLNTFHRMEPPPVLNNSDSRRIQELAGGLTSMYRTDLGESGLRCMNRAIYALPERTCQPPSSAAWSPKPANVLLRSPDCDCNRTGTQTCANPASGGPTPSSRTMRSSDTLINLSHYNISDHLSKKFRSYASHLYGGIQLLIPNEFGIGAKQMSNSSVWPLASRLLNISVTDSGSMPYYLHLFLNISAQKTSYARIWVNTKGYVSMPAYANVLDNLLLRYHISQTNNTKSSNRLSSSDIANYGIAVASYPFKYSATDLMNALERQLTIELSLATFIILALSLVPASFVIFLVEERATGSKRQQFVSGVSPYVYWCCTFFWDIMKFTVPVLCIIVIFAAFNYESYTGSKNIGAFITLLLVYGFGVIPHMYPFTFLFSVPSTAFVVLYSYNVLVGSITTIATFFLDMLSEDDDTLVPINDALKKIFLLFPQYCLGRGMMDLSANFLKYNISEGAYKYDAFSWDTTGEKLCAILVLFLGWFTVLFLMESGLIHRRLRGLLHRCINRPNEKAKQQQTRIDLGNEEDEDVDNERKFVADTDASFYALKVKGLTKVYETGIQCSTSCCKKKATADPEDDGERRKLAVNNISFGVADGECFGLLGVNGAGKTTTFKMLTGEELMSGGEAHINGVSVTADMVAAHRNMGFCPQFDALHSLLTASEELRLYCRLRGVRPELAPAVVERSLVELNLSSHRHKVSSALSGGNKRKLSTAIALIGSPKVIFLDEPTAGMDAGARRFLWSRIQYLTGSKGGLETSSTKGEMPESKASTHAVVLTSHNMEECEVLCHRLAIMVDGRIKCIGTVPRLKARFGNDYQLKVRVSLDQSREKIKKIIQDNFGDASMLQDENFIALVYRFDPVAMKLADVFELFESLKRNDLIIDFSISQITLDEIFVNFVKEKCITRLLSAGLQRSLSSVPNSGRPSEVLVSDPTAQVTPSPDQIYIGFQNKGYDDQASNTPTTDLT